MFQRHAIFDPTKSRNQNKRGNGRFRSPTQSDPWLISRALLMMRHLLICSQWVLDQVVLVIDALVRFNKNVFVGLIFLNPTIGALVSTLFVLMGPNVKFFISYFFHLLNFFSLCSNCTHVWSLSYSMLWFFSCSFWKKNSEMNTTCTQNARDLRNPMWLCEYCCGVEASRCQS